MRLGMNILQEISKDNRETIDDEFGKAEKHLFNIRSLLVEDSKEFKQLDNLILQMNNVRMDLYKREKENKVSNDDYYEELVNKIDSIIREMYNINDFSYDIEDSIYMYYDDIPEEYYENAEFESEIEKIVSSIVKSEFAVDFSYSEYDGEPMYNLNIKIDREER